PHRSPRLPPRRLCRVPVVRPRCPAGRGRRQTHRPHHPGQAHRSRPEAAMSLGTIIRLAVLALLVTFLVTPQSFAWAFAPLTQYGAPAIYNQGNLIDITLNHLWITLLATVASTI